MSPDRSVDANLFRWAEIEARHGWSGILIGNGASRAVWENFKYESLYETATSDRVDNPLSEEDRHIFDELGTRNFEQVLAGLATSQIVCEALDLETGRIQERYESIQRGLFQAVSAVHVPWAEEDTRKYRIIGDSILTYEYVYSTNYDLLVYWAVMAKEGKGFKDYFFSGSTFDLSDTEVWGKATKILYLHGGIHLAKLRTGETYKRRAGNFSNLIDSLAWLSEEDAVPLFITEGTSKDKLNSIFRSDYLSFAYQQFASHEGPLVVFGHSLGEADNHLTDAMKRWGGREIAISVFPNEPEEIIAFKANLHRRLPRAELLFFDSTTHPLGSGDLRVSNGST